MQLQQRCEVYIRMEEHDRCTEEQGAAGCPEDDKGSQGEVRTGSEGGRRAGKAKTAAGGTMGIPHSVQCAETATVKKPDHALLILSGHMALVTRTEWKAYCEAEAAGDIEAVRAFWREIERRQKDSDAGGTDEGSSHSVSGDNDNNCDRRRDREG